VIRRLDQPAVFGASLGLTPVQAAIVAYLYRAGCAWIATKDLNAATADASRKYDHAAKLRSAENVKVQVCFIRAKLGADFILGHTVHGWTLGAPGVLACKRIIGEAA
jgi:hypothetical protein